MLDKIVHIRMLGDFEIEYKNIKLSSCGTRSKKVWLVLAYIIYNSNKKISTNQLVELLWQNSEVTNDPANALKTIIHRIRVLLKDITDDLEAQIILKKSGYYFLNPDINIDFDYIIFNETINKADVSDNQNDKLNLLLNACNLYKGNFLEEFSDNYFVQSLSKFYLNRYKNIVHKALALLEISNDKVIMSELFNSAIQIDPYDEILYYHYLKKLLYDGNNSLVIKIYESLRDLLYSKLGKMPNEATRNIYLKAQSNSNSSPFTMEKLFSEIKEPIDTKGAMICDFNIFKVIYHTTSRILKRNGSVASMALITVDNIKLIKELGNTMFELQLLICSNLRCSDIVAKCSYSQFIILFNNTKTDDCKNALERIFAIINNSSTLKKLKISYQTSSVIPLN